MLSCETQGSYIGLHEEHNTSKYCTVQIGISLSVFFNSRTSGEEQALRRGGVKRVSSGQHSCWQATFFKLISQFLVFLEISYPGRKGGGVAEGQGWRGSGIGRGGYYLYRLMVGLWYMHM